VANPMAPAKGGQRRVGDGHALGDELFMHADQVATAAIDPREDLVAVRRRLLGAFNPWHRRTARFEHRPDRPPGDLQGPGDLADPVALGL